MFMLNQYESYCMTVMVRLRVKVTLAVKVTLVVMVTLGVKVRVSRTDKNRKICIIQNSTGRFLLFFDMLCKIVYSIE